MQSNTRTYINFESRFTNAAVCFAGIGFFLLCVYYFGFKNLAELGLMNVVFFFLLPMLLLAAAAVLLRIVKYNAPQIYSLMAALYCLIMLIRSFTYGSILNSVVGAVWYILAAGVCVCISFQLLKEPRLMAAALLLPAVFRLIFIDIKQYILSLTLIEFFQEAAYLSGLAAFGLLAFSLQTAVKKAKK